VDERKSCEKKRGEQALIGEGAIVTDALVRSIMGFAREMQNT